MLEFLIILFYPIGLIGALFLIPTLFSVLFGNKNPNPIAQLDPISRAIYHAKYKS
jgi:hypothetical protein